MFDVSALVPESQPVAEAAALVYWQHTQPWFVGLLAHGSAYKGGYIPGCSDIDMHLYLRSAAFDETGNLPLEVTIAIQRDLAKIDPSPFQYIQCYPMPDNAPGHGSKSDYLLVPGTYHVIAGSIPKQEATSEQVREKAIRYMENLQPAARTNANHLLQHGGGRLERHARLLCTDVWPTLYSLLVCTGHDPLEVWKMTKQEAIACLPEGEPLGRQIRAFHKSVWAYYGGTQTVEEALELYKNGSVFLYMAKEESVGQAERGML